MPKQMKCRIENTADFSQFVAGGCTTEPFVAKDPREAYENDSIDIPTIYTYTSLVQFLFE